ncbi:MAG TPA: type II toxin-antitoxin system RelE/ParE family toxin [Rhodothermales bacterium]|nr:type II toxin-antitoxin system RelE/ParE family toxin [Rhodothermales bacterium]
MAEVAWRPQALRDLEAIEAYYEEVAPDFAPLFVAGAFEAAERLARFPYIGREVPEMGEEAIREIIYHQFRIIYIVDQDAVEILTVFHSARQFGGLG